MKKSTLFQFLVIIAIGCVAILAVIFGSKHNQKVDATKVTSTRSIVYSDGQSVKAELNAFGGVRGVILLAGDHWSMDQATGKWILVNPKSDQPDTVRIRQMSVRWDNWNNSLEVGLEDSERVVYTSSGGVVYSGRDVTNKYEVIAVNNPGQGAGMNVIRDAATGRIISVWNFRANPSTCIEDVGTSPDKPLYHFGLIDWTQKGNSLACAFQPNKVIDGPISVQDDGTVVIREAQQTTTYTNSGSTIIDRRTE